MFNGSGIEVQGEIYGTAANAYEFDGETEGGAFRSLRTLCEVYMDFPLPSLPDVVHCAERPLKNGMSERAASNAHVLVYLKHAIEENTNAALTAIEEKPNAAELGELVR